MPSGSATVTTPVWGSMANAPLGFSLKEKVTALSVPSASAALATIPTRSPTLAFSAIRSLLASPSAAGEISNSLWSVTRITKFCVVSPPLLEDTFTTIPWLSALSKSSSSGARTKTSPVVESIANRPSASSARE